MKPVDVQMRDDAALGAAWRRCEEALPRGTVVTLTVSRFAVEGKETAIATADTYGEFESATDAHGPTPAAALEALAEALEARRG